MISACSSTDPILFLTEKLLKLSGLVYNTRQAEQLCVLVHLLSKWNQSVNLTARAPEQRLLIAHIMDSAVVMPFLEGERIADAGTGAGFPGLVLAVLCPERRFELIDSITKKTAFIKAAAAQLELTNISVHTARCEDLKGILDCDTVVSRAMAPLGKLVSLVFPLLHNRGSLLAMKANISTSELNEIPNIMRVDKIIRLNVPGSNALRQLVKLVRT